MIFTSESVTQGHPDKICDSISDAILDECLRQDPKSRVAIDTWVKDNRVGVIGELTSSAEVDFETIARDTIRKIGYNRDELGFNADTCIVEIHIGAQSSEIHDAVDQDPETIGAGDQGIMFGYATNQTPELMPLTHLLAHRIAEKLHSTRLNLENKNDFTLRPDGKTQVSIAYDQAGIPLSLDTIVISTQHSPEISLTDLTTLIQESVIYPTLQDTNFTHLISPDTRFLINPSGSFILGGPVADSGLTGRKIVVDGYGGWGRVGGGAFSGKDASKVDRSAAYMARHLAKQIVSQGWADDAEVQLSYAIGVAEPVSIHLTGALNKGAEEIIQWIQTSYDLRPYGIIQYLGLSNPIFSPTSAYGHFGREPKNGLFSWEK